MRACKAQAEAIVKFELINEQQRLRRKRFYLRAGYTEAPVKYRWQNENYEILSFRGEVSEQDYEDFWKHFRA